jgi:hypothetical protein
MTTPNSNTPAKPNIDLQADAMASDDARASAGDMISRPANYAGEPLKMQRPMGLPCNVGRTEQKFRLGTGTALLAAAAFAPVSRGLQIGLAAVGVAELITGSLRYCPVSQALGINTCQAER